MPVSQADIDALTEALATGERMVRKGDKTVEYRSIAEIIDARNALLTLKAAEDAAVKGLVQRKQTRLYYGGRGY